MVDKRKPHSWPLHLDTPKPGTSALSDFSLQLLGSQHSSVCTSTHTTYGIHAAMVMMLAPKLVRILHAHTHTFVH